MKKTPFMNIRNQKFFLRALLAVVILLAGKPSVSFAYLPSCSFLNGTTQNLTVAKNSGTTDISSLLVVVSRGAGGSVVWSSSVAPTNGTISVAYSATVAASVLTRTFTPTGLTYTPATGFIGTDSFIVHADYAFGPASGNTTIYVTVLSPSDINISVGTTVVLSGDVNVSVDVDSFINNGTYTDNTGSFNVVSPLNFSGSGTTHLDSLVFNTTGGTSLVNQLVSVYGTAIIGTGSTVNANDSLYIRSDAGNAKLINDGILTGNVQGLIAKATTTNGSCSPYTSALTLNVSGTEMAYQWQSSGDSSSWNNVVGANSAAYTATVNATSYYRCNLTTLNTAFAESTPGVKLNYTAFTNTVAITSQPSNVTVCSGSVPTFSVAATGTGVSYKWYLSTNGGTSYSFIGAATSSFTLTPTVASSLNGDLFECVVSGTCAAPDTSAAVTLSVIATPSVTVTSDPSITEGATSANLPYTATGAPTTYSITYDAAAQLAGLNNVPTATLTATPIVLSVPGIIVPATYNGSVTVTNSCLTSAPKAFTLTILSGNAVPVFNNGVAQTLAVCENSGANTINSLFTTTDPDASQTETYSVTVAPVNGTLSGFPATAASGGSAIIPAGLIYTPNTNYSGADAFTIQVNDGHGGIAATVITVTVNPTPVMTVTPTSQTVCNNANTSTEVFSSNVSGTTFTWANNNNTIGIGLSGSGSAIASFTATNTGSAPASGVFTVTPQANSCFGPVQIFTVNVNPTPIMTVTPTSQSVCHFSNTSAEVFSSNVSGTTFTWANNNTSIGIGGSGSGSAIASFTATNSGSAPASGVFTVTPLANSCFGPQQIFTITVNPTPIMTVTPTSQTVCNNANTTTEVFSSNVSGATFSWANDNNTIGIGLSGSGSNIASFTATNTGVAATKGVFTVTPSAGGCAGPVQTFTVNVNPTPIMTVTPTSQSVCHFSNTSAEVFSSNVSGTTFTWANNNTSIGIGGSGSGSAIASFTATNSGSAPASGVFTVTPLANSCLGPVHLFTVTVNPTPVMTVTPASQTVCNNTNTTAEVFSSNVSGATFTWVNSNNTIGIGSSGSGGSIASFTANYTSGSGTTSGVFTVTPHANSCVGPLQTFTVTVEASPSITLSAGPTVLQGATSANLGYVATTGIPDHYSITWSSAATTAGFTPVSNSALPASPISIAVPAAAPAAVYNGTLTVSNSNGCISNNLAFTITVNSALSFIGGSSQVLPVCENSGVTNINSLLEINDGSTGVTDTWSIVTGPSNGALAGLPYNNLSNGGNVTPTGLTYTPNTNYSGSDAFVIQVANGTATITTTVTVTVNPLPVLTVTPTSQNVCNNANTTTELFSSNVSGTTFTWANDNTTIGIGASGNGSTIASFTAMNSGSAPASGVFTVTPLANSCFGPQQIFTITVNPTPIMTVTPTSQTVCNNANTATEVFSGNVSGATYTWTNSDGSIGLATSGTGNIPAFVAANTTNVSNTATITVTPSANTCSGVAQKITITVNPTPDVAAITSQSVCNTASAAAVNFSGSVAGTIYNWTNSDNSIGLATTGTGTIAAFTATNATSTINTATITVTPVYVTCSGTPASFTISVDPTPGVTGLSNQIVCNTATTTVETLSSSVSGTTYTWTNSDGSIGLATSGTGNIPAFVAANTTNAANTATITVTPSANTCGGAAQKITITVNPTPDVNGYFNQSVCHFNQSTPVDFTSSVSGATFSWTNNNTSVNLGSNGTGNIAAFTALNTTTVSSTATITVTPSANSCNGTPQNFTITVNPDPNITSVGNQAVCNGAMTAAVSFSADVAGATYTWTNSNTSIGLASTGTGNIAAFTAANIGSSVQTAVITVVPSANGCNGAQTSFTFTVNPTPDVIGLSNQAVCNTASTSTETLSSSVLGTTYTWTNSDGSIGLATSGTGNIPAFAATNTTSAANTATITVTPSANTCAGAAQSITITVNPTPDVAAITSQSVCNTATTAAINFTGSVAGTIYNWTNSDNSIGLATTGTGTIAAFTATNATSTINTATITVTPVYGTCYGTAASFTISVDPTPDVNGYGDQSVCNNAILPGTTFGSTTPGTTYSWTNSDPSISLAASGTGNIVAFTATNGTNAVNVVTITVTPSANTCSGAAQMFTITVNPTSDVAAISGQTICNNTATSAVSFSNSVAGTANTWTNSDNSIGLAASGSGNIGSFIATNATSAINTATITVTPSANSCIGLSQSFTISVDPTPGVNNYGDQSVCNNAVLPGTIFGSPTAGATYTWTNSDGSIGLATTGSGDIAAFTAFNSSNAIVTATITVTPSANGCAGAPADFTIAVAPTPDVTAISNQTLCNNATTTAINFANSVAGTVNTWTNSDGSIGLPGSGSGDIASFVATNSTNAINTATITVTPSANSCVGLTQQFTITVNPTPDVSGYSDQAICNGTLTAAETFTSTVTGATYSWTSSDGTIGLATSGSGNIFSFTATNATNAINTATITVTPSANTCDGAPQMFTIAVNPTPDVAAVSDQTICNNSATSAVNFTSGVTGTAYTWTNNDGSIGLATSGSGNIPSFIATNSSTVAVTATVTVTPMANGCAGSAGSFAITVNAGPTVDAVASQVVCNNAATTDINFTGYAAGTLYSWTNSDGAIGLATSGTGNIPSFIATNTTNAINTATITVTPSDGSCPGTAGMFTITVNPTPDVSGYGDQAICNGALTAAETFTSTVSGAAYSWTNSDGSIGITTTGTGNIAAFTASNITSDPIAAIITVTPSANGCAGAPQSFTYTVNPTPEVAAITSQTICNTGISAAVVFSGTVTGTSYSWTNSDGSIGLATSGTGSIPSFTVANSTSAINIATITVTPSTTTCGGNSQSFTIQANPTPDVTGYTDQAICNGATTAAETFTSTVTGAIYSWTNSDGSIGLTSTGTGNIAGFTAANITSGPVAALVTVTPSANGCVGAPQSFTYTVNPTPEVAAIISQTVCNTASSAAVVFSGTVTGTSYSWTNSDGSIGLAASGTGSSIPSFTVTNTTSAIRTATITVTSATSTCGGNSQSFTIQANPTPGVGGYANQAICNGVLTAAETFTSAVTGATYTWTNGNGSINLATTGTGNIAGFTAANITSGPVAALVTVTPSANGCVGAPQSFTYTVNPTPEVAAIISQTVCNTASSAAVVFSGTVTGTSYSWTNSDGSIGLATSGTGSSIPSFTVANITSAIRTATITVTSATSTCGGNSQSFTIQANPTPGVGGYANQAICNGVLTAAETFTSAVTGATYTWTNSNGSINLATTGTGDIAGFNAANITSGPVTALVTVTPSANGCVGAPQSFTYTVNPAPEVAPVSSQTVCNTATTLPITFTGTVTGTSYSWTNSDPSINLAGSGAGNSIPSFTVSNTTSAIRTATITVTSATSTCGGSSQSFTIQVNPTPNVTGFEGQAICNGTADTAETFASSVAGATYTWTNSNSGIGLASSGSGDVAVFTATNSTTAPVTATIAVTPSANGCIGSAQSFVYTVNPTPVLTSTLTPASICDNATFAYTSGSATIGTSFTWSRASTAGISNTAASGAGAISEILTDTTVNPVSVAYVDTLKANGCVNTQTVTVTVEPNPMLSTLLNNGAICDSTAFTYVPNSLTTGTAYTWSRSVVAGISNSAGAGTGAINEILINTTVDPQVVTYVDTLHANGCINTQSVTVTVNPLPKLSTPLAAGAVCSSSPFVYGPNSLTGGTTYTWSRNVVAGISNTAGSGVDTINETLINTTAAQIAVMYVDTLHYHGCINTQTVTVTVSPTPLLTSTLTPTAICDSTQFLYVPTSATGVATFTWSRGTIAGISNAAANGVDTINEVLVNTTANPLSVVYMDTLHAYGCINTQSVTVTVYPLPLLTSSLTAGSVCDSNVFNYTPASDVTGPSFNWTRATVTGISNPASFGTSDPTENLYNTTHANVTVTYVYTVSANGCCGNPYDVTVVVHPTPKLSSPLTDSICSGVAFTYTAVGTSSGSTFSWHRAAIAGISNGTASGTTAIDEVLTDTTAFAVHPVYVYTIGYQGCSFVQDLTVKVNPQVQPPVISTESPDALCSNTMYQNFGAATAELAGVTYNWSADGAQVWATGAGRQYSLVNFLAPGDAVVKLTATSSSTQCSSFATYSVTVNSSFAQYPVVVYSYGQFICLQNDEDSYQWGYDDKATLDSTMLIGEINQNYVNANPGNDKLYWVMVNSHGCTQKAYVNAPTGVTTVNAGNTEIKIYPNPTNDMVNVDINTTVSGNMEVELLNIMGQRLYTEPVVNNKAQLNVSGLTGGTYIINCYRDGVRIQSAKLIKN